MPTYNWANEWTYMDTGAASYFTGQFFLKNRYKIVYVMPGRYSISVLNYKEKATGDNRLSRSAKLYEDHAWCVNVTKTPEIGNVEDEDAGE